MGRDFLRKPFWTMFIVFLLVAISLGFVALSTIVENSLTIESSQSRAAAVLPSTSTALLGLSSVELNEETEKYHISGKYPVFGIPELDGKVLDTVNAGIAEIKNAERPLIDGMKIDFSVSIEDVYIDSRLISFKLFIYKFTGANHGFTEVYGFNYDKVESRLLTLSDVLKLLNMGIEDLASATKKQLKPKMEYGLDETGISPVFENFSTFVVDDTSVTFLFQEYQVGSYIDGMKEVTFARVD